jgi:preprotein translocase subunit SecB
MKIINSPLQLIASVLGKITIKEFTPKNNKFKTIPLSEYLINLDFNILEKDNLNFAIDINIDINNSGKKLPGYTISASIRYIFKISDKTKLDDNIIENFKLLSAISIAISKLRSQLENATNSYQFGAYYLPSIDIKQLIDDKITQMDDLHHKPV